MKYILTVNGDWKEYHDVNLSNEKRYPDKDRLSSILRRQIDTLHDLVNGKYLHFIHSSPLARTFFLNPEFMELWEEVVDKGGDLGVHCHEDIPGKEYNYDDIYKMMYVVREQVNIMRNNGLETMSYRGGYYAFTQELLIVLRKSRIKFDFSCKPGYFYEFKDKVISDWRGASVCVYEISQDDHKKQGHSNIYEVPVGSYKNKYLELDNLKEEDLRRIAEGLDKEIDEKEQLSIVSVVTNSFNYGKEEKVKNIIRNINILKEYGRFITVKELEKLV